MTGAFVQINRRWMLIEMDSVDAASSRGINTVVLLDFTTNGDVEDLATPLSHAALVKRFVEGSWPA